MPCPKRRIHCVLMTFMMAADDMDTRVGMIEQLALVRDGLLSLSLSDNPHAADDHIE